MVGRALTVIQAPTVKDGVFFYVRIAYRRTVFDRDRLRLRLLSAG